MNIQKAANLAAVGQSRPQEKTVPLSTLLQVAAASIALVAAEDATRTAHDAYTGRIRKFERAHGRLGCHLNLSKPEHAVEYTAATYDRYPLAKRHIYNAKRRLLTAVRRAQRGGA